MAISVGPFTALSLPRMQAGRLPAQARRLASCAIISFFLALVTWFFWAGAMRIGTLAFAPHPIDTLVKPAYWTVRQSLAFWHSPLVLVAIPSCLLLSCWRPAQSGTRLLSRSLLTDVAWSVSRTTVTVLLLVAYADFLDGVAMRHLGWAIFATPDWPVYVKGAITFMVVDFLYWLRHLILHKVPVLWHFHAIHHSQENLNPFSIDRIHPVEFLLTLSLMFIPVFIVTHSLQVTLGYYLLWRAYDAFIHSNIRSNLGWLNHLVVTPQAHRVHHSNWVEHYDCNYGSVLSIWDSLFGTRHADITVYPTTGIPEPDFPRERPGCNAAVTLWRQFLYPFPAVRRTMRKSAHSRLRT